MIRVASYCRVSTDLEDQVNSLEAQRRYFGDYIRNQPGWSLYEIYADEGISGTGTKKRTEFNRMIGDALEGKFQLIVTKEVSRFSRNILDTIAYTRELRAHGVGVIFMTDGISTLEPDAELRLSIMASIAQEESRKTSARVKWGQTRQMERGVVFGHSLLGYELKAGKLTVNPEEAAVVQRIYRLYGTEKRSAGEIAKLLQEETPALSGNRKWSASYILKILKNEKYAGDLLQKKTYTPDYLTHEKKTNHGAEEKILLKNHHEAIVARELWDEVQTEVRIRSGGKKGTVSRRFVLSGKIRCGECGAGFVARQKRHRDGSCIRRWSCATAVREGSKIRVDQSGAAFGCTVGRLLRDDDAIHMLQVALRALRLDRMDISESVAGLAAAVLREEALGAAEQAERLQREKERLYRKKEAALDAYFAGEICKEELQGARNRYDNELEVLQRRAISVKEKNNTVIELEGVKESIKEELIQILSGATVSDAFYKSVLEQLTVFRDGRLKLTLRELPLVFWFSKSEPHFFGTD